MVNAGRGALATLPACVWVAIVGCREAGRFPTEGWDAARCGGGMHSERARPTSVRRGIGRCPNHGPWDAHMSVAFVRDFVV